MLNDRKMLGEIINDDIYKMVSVNRFSTRNRLHEENIAAHTFFVGYLARIMGGMCNLDNGEMATLLKMCLVHDVPESILGDIIAPVKDSIPEFAHAYEKMELKVMEENYPELKMDFDIMRLEEEQDTLVFKIFKLADMLSVVLYCEEEFRLGSRSEEMQYIYSRMVNRCKKRWDEIKDICDKEKKAKKPINIKNIMSK